MGELREQMQYDLVVRGLVPRTQESYLAAMKGLAHCRGRECPAEFSPPFRQPMSEDNMTQQAIFGPFFATMFLTLLVWVYMYIRRISFITSNKFGSKELATPGALAQLSPPVVANLLARKSVPLARRSFSALKAGARARRREAVT